MTVTLHLSEILLIIVTVCVGGVAFYLVGALKRLASVLQELERTLGRAGELMPKIEATALQARETLSSVQRLADEGQRVVTDVAEVTAAARSVAEEGARQVQGILEAVGQVGAIIKGFESGLKLFKKDCAEPEREDPAQEE